MRREMRPRLARTVCDPSRGRWRARGCVPGGALRDPRLPSGTAPRSCALPAAVKTDRRWPFRAHPTRPITNCSAWIGAGGLARLRYCTAMCRIDAMAVGDALRVCGPRASY
jgi:hypothetical protein